MNPADCASRSVTIDQLKDYCGGPGHNGSLRIKTHRHLNLNCVLYLVTQKLVLKCPYWSHLIIIISLGFGVQILIVKQVIEDHCFLHSIHSQVQTLIRLTSISSLSPGLGTDTAFF